MKRLTLVRKWIDPDRTMGELVYQGEHFLFTMEPGAADTEFPRIDPGFYHCVPHASEKFGDTWALEGVDVTHWATVGIARSTILFHRGNVDEETRGCILLGKGRGKVNNEPAVIRSQEAMTKLRDLIGDDGEFYLIVK